MTEHTFVLRGDTIRTLYADDLDLDALGALHVERASHVEYDDARQGWIVLQPDGKTPMIIEAGHTCRVDLCQCPPRVFSTRAQALAAEVAYVTEHVL